ncbi:hypothetical protein LWI29_024335 [Acer saccharum]|uniref:Uncharacterized protein n=1 Tax=Acer saccharum TaxID=4024 RepID=A0AA39SG86_ACESA|nr:hypothetical protein LWI29_024335 [Acer saccharum]
MTPKVVAELIHMAMVPKSRVPQETQGAVIKCLTAQGKEQYLSDTKPATDSKDYHNWVKEDTMVTTWLWNNMEPPIATTTMWVDTIKELWDFLQDRLFNLKTSLGLMIAMYHSFPVNNMTSLSVNTIEFLKDCGENSILIILSLQMKLKFVSKGKSW